MLIRSLALSVATAVLLVPRLSGAETWANKLQHTLLLGRQGHYREAAENYVSLIAEPAVKADAEVYAYVLSELAAVEIELGSYQSAEARTREGFSALARAHKSDTAMSAIVQGVLAEALAIQGNSAEAKRISKQAVELGRRTLGPSAPRFAILLSTRARALEQSGDLKGAQDACIEAMKIFQKVQPANAIELGTTYQNLAVIYTARSKPEKGLEYVALALDTWRRVLPPDHPFITYALNTEVLSYNKLKAYRKAEEIIPEMLRLGEAQFAPDNPERMILLNDAAVTFAREQRYTEAEPLLRQAVAIGKQRLPSGHPFLRNTLLNYSYVLEKLDRSADAAHHRAEADILMAFPQKPGP